MTFICSWRCDRAASDDLRWVRGLADVRTTKQGGDPMTPVDLNRLREALADVDETTFHLLDQLAQAVLDAPTVWWCETDMRGDAKPIPDNAAIVATRGRCGGCGYAPGKSRCGWVSLVPVKGES